MKNITLIKLLGELDPEAEVSIQVKDNIHDTNMTSYDITCKTNDKGELTLVVSLD